MEAKTTPEVATPPIQIVSRLLKVEKFIAYLLEKDHDCCPVFTFDRKGYLSYATIAQWAFDKDMMKPFSYANGKHEEHESDLSITSNGIIYSKKRDAFIAKGRTYIAINDKKFPKWLTDLSEIESHDVVLDEWLTPEEREVLRKDKVIGRSYEIPTDSASIKVYTQDKDIQVLG